MKILSLIISLSLYICSVAQPKIGVTAGLNLPWLNFKGTSTSNPGKTKFDMITSFHAGVIADFKISEKINFQPGLQISGRGGQFTSTLFNATRELRFYYLEMPLVVNYNIPVGKNKVFIGAGASLAYGLSGKDKQTYFTRNPFENEFRKFDAGIIARAGFRRKNIQASVIYNFGVANIWDNDNPNLPPGQTTDCRNNMISFSAAYFFKFL
jgi:hypothetical protein